MYRVEVKARADPDHARAAITELGADWLGTVTQIDAYYTHPTRSFAEADEALRIRHQTHKATPNDSPPSGSPITFLTYKGPRIDQETKTRVEHETTVSNKTELASILTALGFEQAHTVEKTRGQFEYSEFRIVIDRVHDLGHFVEVEAHGTDNTLDQIRSEATELLTTITGQQDGIIWDSYLELILNNN